MLTILQLKENKIFFSFFRRGRAPAEHIIVAPRTPAVETLAAQLTEDNADFANRGRYHQSEVLQGENFDDYDSD